ncbi:Oidioi.mRNA.OKI2018_I69.chr1.g134.t1.cds [Oikopleura dioica]|uniref:Oidioi.mRNA.OKI2018_I69.chr1.g134.t1.cds n=1 Tax=Oikopleura dioica TaxID=34765 RepID=A0ABN7SJE1_OIKDI|nr:Oidioi.mRNA.OKI2018_I69.chr1.g134.t1.cds [Oikopleura dioica]
MTSGWNIISQMSPKDKRPISSSCHYNSVNLNEKFIFTRPLTVTGAYLYPSGEILFHQMTLDRIENDEYMLQNNDFKEHSPVLRIPLKNPYYAAYEYFCDIYFKTQCNLYEDDEIKLQIVNDEYGNMDENTWYLLPEAYTLELIPTFPIEDVIKVKSNAKDLADNLKAMGFENQAICDAVSCCKGDIVNAVDLLMAATINGENKNSIL